MDMFRAFTLHDDTVRSASQQSVTRQNAGRSEVLHGGDKTIVRTELLVPQSVVSAESSRDIHLVHWGVVAHPRIAYSHGFCKVSQVCGKLRILVIADPIRHPEMHEVENRRDLESLYFCHHLVGEGPVILVRRKMHSIVWQTVAKHLQAQCFHECKIFFPSCIVAALLEHVAANASVVDCGIRAFDARREHEVATFGDGHSASAVGGTRTRRGTIGIIAVNAAHNIKEALGHALN